VLAAGSGVPSAGFAQVDGLQAALYPGRWRGWPWRSRYRAWPWLDGAPDLLDTVLSGPVPCGLAAFTGGTSFRARGAPAMACGGDAGLRALTLINAITK
jgi:hypothetical protein